MAQQSLGGKDSLHIWLEIAPKCDQDSIWPVLSSNYMYLGIDTTTLNDEHVLELINKMVACRQPVSNTEGLLEP